MLHFFVYVSIIFGLYWTRCCGEDAVAEMPFLTARWLNRFKTLLDTGSIFTFTCNNVCIMNDSSGSNVQYKLRPILDGKTVVGPQYSSASHQRGMMKTQAYWPILNLKENFVQEFKQGEEEEEEDGRWWKNIERGKRERERERGRGKDITY